MRRVLLQTAEPTLQQAELPFDLPEQVLDSPSDSRATGVGMHARILDMQQFVGDHDLHHICRPRYRRVHQPPVSVETGVRLHLNERLVALPPLVHLRVAFPLIGLAQARRRDDRGEQVPQRPQRDSRHLRVEDDVAARPIPPSRVLRVTASKLARVALPLNERTAPAVLGVTYSEDPSRSNRHYALRFSNRYITPQRASLDFVPSRSIVPCPRPLERKTR